MATEIVGSFRRWGMRRDREGHREYHITFIVKCGANDGPYNVLQTSGLPLPGTVWDYGDDYDGYAYCKLDADVKEVASEEAGSRLFHVDFIYSTKSDAKSCKEAQIENPLLQPQEVSGSSQKYQKESLYDRFGKMIGNSAWEPFSGPQNEWDEGRDRIRIRQNVSSLQLSTCVGMRDKVNDRPLWGMPPRTIKLSDFSWEKKYYGQCFAYYVRTFDFDIRADTFDRDILNEGSKALNGYFDFFGAWTREPVTKGGLNPDYNELGDLDDPDTSKPLNPNPMNPQHFTRFKDPKDENARTVLNLDGTPYETLINVTTCAQCPDGAPQEWIISAGGHFMDTVKLEYEGSGCSWVGTEYKVTIRTDWTGTGTTGLEDNFTKVDLKINLVYDGFWKIYVRHNADPEIMAVYAYQEDDEGPWECLGPNILVKTYGDLSYQTEVAISMAGPPSIHVEKYLEANFLLLGIPAVV